MSLSTSQRTYLDHNATAPLGAGVAAAMSDCLGVMGNPASPHTEGRQARALVEGARRTIAETLGCAPLDFVFCSGGTEANHLGLLALARTRPALEAIVLSEAVHPSLSAVGDFLREQGRLVVAPELRSDGGVDLGALDEKLGNTPCSLVAVSWANHETGTIEDMAALRTWADKRGAMVFADAVQAFGKIPLDIGLVDGLSVSGHKVGGPKGVGGLWLRPGPQVGPVIGGGKQENGLRPGTPALPNIVGFAKACEGLDARITAFAELRSLQAEVRAGVEALGAQFLSGLGLSNTILSRFPGVNAEPLVAALDLAGFAISTGAACSSGSTAPSPNLLAQGVSASEAKEVLRISMGPENTADELKAFLEQLGPILARVKSFS